MRMIRQRLPEVADMMISCLSERSGLRHLDAAIACRARQSGEQSPQPRHISLRIICQECVTAFPRVVDSAGMHSRRACVVAVLWQLSRALQCLSAFSHVSTLTSSECSFCDVFGFPPSCLPTLAGVAVFSTALATTVQVVRGQGCWGDVVLLWSQQQLACAAKQERGCPPTSS